MSDPLAGSDTYDMLGGVLENEKRASLPRDMRAWARMDEADSAQVDWARKARWMLNEASYEIERLRGKNG